MNTQTENNNNWKKKVKLTKHFMERYHERVLDRDLPEKFHYSKVQTKIYSDMNERLLDREKNFIELLSSPSCNIKVPFESIGHLVIKNGKLITVLN